MPWFGSSSSVKYSKKRTYYVAGEDGRNRKRASLGRQNEVAPPAGILKRSGRTRSSSYTFEDGMVPQEMAAAVPMPSEQKVNAMFAEMVDELGLSRELMFKLPLEKRWEVYLSKQKEQQSAKGADPQPEFYIDKIAHLTEMLQGVKSSESADMETNLTITSELKTALRTQPLGFVLRFIDLNGLEQLLVFLKGMSNPVRNSQLHHAIIGCVKALMNSPDGRAHVLAHPRAITVIAQSLKSSITKTKILVLEILGALCLVPGGHKKVLNAMDNFQKFAVERIRFQTLIVDLTRSLDEPQDSANLQIAVLSFFNALINYKAGEESLEFRMHLRHELLLLGILPIIDRLRALNIAHLNRHLEIFELVQIEDERELAARLETIQVDSRSLRSMVDLLQRKTVHTVAHSHLLSIVYHCLLLPIDDPHYPKYWHLIDRLVQQVVLQQRRGVDPDSAPLPINVDNLVQQLLREDEIKAIQWEAEEVRKDRDQVKFKLRKKEWEFDSVRMECEQYKSNVERLRLRLNRKAAELNESWTREQDLQDRLQQLDQKSEEYRRRIEQLESLLKERNISMSSLPPLESAAPPPPPPPPSLPLPPPPPPPPPSTTEQPKQTQIDSATQILPAPPLPGSSSPVRSVLQRRPPPKPTQALKSFNWAKLPDFHIKKTIWSSIDDSTVHEVMDLKDFEETFSAYQRKESETSLTGTLRRRSVLDRPKELSVIESKKAQNCAIVLSNLKMANRELRQVVMCMDREDRLSKDMVEQMLKYIPTPAERELLESHAHEVESFAKPDRFLLEMSKIPRYSQRLKSLFFKKTLSDRVGDVRPRIEAIHYTCKELLTSQKLKKVLEVVLAFGNFMNRGRRGNAHGFRLSSLNKMGDTKSSTDRDVNLLHYLVMTLESKFPDALTLETELPHIKKASKVDFKEVEKEFADMQMDLRDLLHELEFQRRSGTSDPEDLFVPVMEEFASDVRAIFADIEALITETKADFQNTLLFFGEDPKECTTEEFFGIFTTFLHSFNEAHVELIAVRKRREEEEKRREEMERQKQLTLQRRKKRQQAQAAGALSEASAKEGTDYAEKAELDDLIAVLKSGEYFERRKNRRNSRVLEFSRERLPSQSSVNDSMNQ